MGCGDWSDVSRETRRGRGRVHCAGATDPKPLWQSSHSPKRKEATPRAAQRPRQAIPACGLGERHGGFALAGERSMRLECGSSDHPSPAIRYLRASDGHVPRRRPAVISGDRRKEAPRGTRRQRPCTRQASPAPMCPRARSPRGRFRAPRPGRRRTGTEERVGPDNHLSSCSCRIIPITSRIMDPNDEQDTAEFPRSIPETGPHTHHARVVRGRSRSGRLVAPGLGTDQERRPLPGPQRRPSHADVDDELAGRLRAARVRGDDVWDRRGRRPGGRAAGEVASRLALTILVELVLATPDWIFSLDEPGLSDVFDRAAVRFAP